jgi:Protein kinase domain
MRYVEGRDLKERLQRGRLDPGDAIGILAQVASALDAAHARGLVHRDVKPSNVLLDTGARPDGSDHVYLADFGLTRRASDESGIGDNGKLMGTISYVAPEQITAYRDAGGVHGAVARLAESTFARTPDGQEPIVRALMLRLVGEDEGEVPVRRRAPLAELDLERNADAAAVLATLADSRLVTLGEGSVEVPHEALLHEWPRLREWIEEDSEGRRLRRHITQVATEWDAAGRDEGELYRGARLAAALDWSTDHAFELNELEREFVTESRDASEKETRRVRRTNRRLLALLAGVAVLLVAAVAGGIFAVVQRGEARDAETAQLAQRLGAQALVEEDLDLCCCSPARRSRSTTRRRPAATCSPTS